MLIDTKHPLAQGAYLRDPYSKKRIGNSFAVDTATGESHEYVIGDDGKLAHTPLREKEGGGIEREIITKIVMRPWELIHRESSQTIARSKL